MKLMKYLSAVRSHFSMVRLGYDLGDRLALFGYALGMSIPYKSHNSFAAYISKHLQPDLGDVTIWFKGDLFRLIDGSSLDMFKPSFEPWMPDYLRLESDQVFIDVGAHIGRHAIPAAQIAKLVIAIEPDYDAVKVLAQNIIINELMDKVIFTSALAWDAEEEVPFYDGDLSDNGTASEYVAKQRGIYNASPDLVQGRKIDDMLERWNVTRVDLVKIDVEGTEYEVLKGMEETLKVFKPRLIVECKSNRAIEYLMKLGYASEHIAGEYYYFERLAK